MPLRGDTYIYYLQDLHSPDNSGLGETNISDPFRIIV